MAIYHANDTLEPGQNFATPEELFRFAQRKYVLETEEQFLRPLYFDWIGGDCDDQAIYIAAWYIARGISLDRVFFAEAAQQKDYFEHVIALIQYGGPGEIMAFDALPGMEFDALSGNQFRLTKLNDTDYQPYILEMKKAHQAA